MLINSIANECLSDEDCAKLCDLALPVLDHQVTLEVTEGEPLNAELTARCQAYEKSLEGVLSSSSWRITSPFRRLLGWFHRSR